MTKRPAASAIIVNWNARTDLLKCLESLRQHKIQGGLEVIVVDNGSSDGSQSAVSENFPEVLLIQNDYNMGFAKANNVGIEVASGYHYFFINSDVIVLNNCLFKMLTHLEKNNEIGMMGPKVLTGEGDVQRSCMGLPTLWNTLCRACALDTLFPRNSLFGGKLLTYWPHDTERYAEVINGCFWLVRGEALQDVGLMSEDFFIYGEDVDWCKRFSDNGWKVKFYPNAEIIHIGGVSSSNAPERFYIELFRSELIYWKKYHGYFSSLAYILILQLHQVVRILASLPLLLMKKKEYSKIYRQIKIYWICMWSLKSPGLSGGKKSA